MSRRARKEGTIYKKTEVKNGKKYTYWEAQVTVGYDDGKRRRIRKTFHGKSQQEVKEKMQDASVSLQKKDFFEPSKATLSQWIDIWLNEYCAHIKYQTRKNYKSQCETHIKPMLGEIPLAELTSEHIQKFYNRLAEDGRKVTRKDSQTGRTETTTAPLSPKSIKNVHSVLSKCLNEAIEQKYLRYNPCTTTKRPKVQKPEIEPLSDEEIKQFLAALEKEEFSDLYKVIVFTGLRKSEALGLSWDNINFKTNTIKINRQLQKRPIRDGGYTIATVKSDRIRIITVSQFVIDVLTNRRAKQNADKERLGKYWFDFKRPDGKSASLVFTKEDGSPINPKAVYLHYNKIAKQYGFNASRVHDLRHTFAVISLENGDDYKTIQENLGHASASFTLDVYGHRSSKMQRDSASRMQSFIDNISTSKNDKKS